MKTSKDIYIPEWFRQDDRNVIVATKLLTHVIEKQKTKQNLTITYKNLASIVDCGLTCRTIDSFLGYISDVCKENGLPYISGIVVNKETSIPGVGYYNYYYSIDKDDIEAQIKQFKDDYKTIEECIYWEDLLNKLQK